MDDWHRLTQVDLEARTAVCSICGPTSIRVRRYPRKYGEGVSRQCMTLRRAQRKSRNGPRTDAERAATVAAQGGRCAACGEAGHQLLDDHDHGTGAPRGMLCRRCNSVLGSVKDSPDLLRELAVYLERWRGSCALQA